MTLDSLKSQAGVSGSKDGIRAVSRAQRSSISPVMKTPAPPKIVDFRNASGLVVGLKRVGGRSASTSRLSNFTKKGKPLNERKF